MMSFRKGWLLVLLLFLFSSCQTIGGGETNPDEWIKRTIGEIGNTLITIGHTMTGDGNAPESGTKPATNPPLVQSEPKPPKPEPRLEDPTPLGRPAESTKGGGISPEGTQPIIVDGSELELIVIPRTYTPPPPNRNGIIVIPPAPPY